MRLFIRSLFYLTNLRIWNTFISTLQFLCPINSEDRQYSSSIVDQFIQKWKLNPKVLWNVLIWGLIVLKLWLKTVQYWVLEVFVPNQFALQQSGVHKGTKTITSMLTSGLLVPVARQKHIKATWSGSWVACILFANEPLQGFEWNRSDTSSRWSCCVQPFLDFYWCWRHKRLRPKLLK